MHRMSRTQKGSDVTRGDIYLNDCFMEYWKTKEEVFSPLAEHSGNKSLRIDNAGCSPDTKAIMV